MRISDGVKYSLYMCSLIRVSNWLSGFLGVDKKVQGGNRIPVFIDTIYGFPSLLTHFCGNWRKASKWAWRAVQVISGLYLNNTICVISGAGEEGRETSPIFVLFC